MRWAITWDAVDCFEKAIELKPGTAVLMHVMCAISLLQGGNPLGSIRQFDAAIRIDPGNCTGVLISRLWFCMGRKTMTGQ